MAAERTGNGTDYAEKVRKLLALSQSPNEHEARSAMLKARQLMAEHKLSEAEIRRRDGEVQTVLTDITCGKRRDPWVVDLSVVIAENYCCQAYRARYKHKQTVAIGFIGFPEDAEVCVSVFRYAVDCVRTQVKRMRKLMEGYDPEYVRRCTDGYGYGFTEGCGEAFSRQQKEKPDTWSLVLVKPKEVTEAAKGMGHKEYKARTMRDIPEDAFTEGYRTGTEFDPNHRITEKEAG